MFRFISHCRKEKVLNGGNPLTKKPISDFFSLQENGSENSLHELQLSVAIQVWKLYGQMS